MPATATAATRPFAIPLTELDPRLWGRVSVRTPERRVGRLVQIDGRWRLRDVYDEPDYRSRGSLPAVRPAWSPPAVWVDPAECVLEPRDPETGARVVSAVLQALADVHCPAKLRDEVRSRGGKLQRAAIPGWLLLTPTPFALHLYAEGPEWDPDQGPRPDLRVPGLEDDLERHDAAACIWRALADHGDLVVPHRTQALVLRDQAASGEAASA